MGMMRIPGNTAFAFRGRSVPSADKVKLPEGEIVRGREEKSHRDKSEKSEKKMHFGLLFAFCFMYNGI